MAMVLIVTHGIWSISHRGMEIAWTKKRSAMKIIGASMNGAMLERAAQTGLKAILLLIRIIATKFVGFQIATNP